jgi:hypothetical protein
MLPLLQPQEPQIYTRSATLEDGIGRRLGASVTPFFTINELNTQAEFLDGQTYTGESGSYTSRDFNQQVDTLDISFSSSPDEFEVEQGAGITCPRLSNDLPCASYNRIFYLPPTLKTGEVVNGVFVRADYVCGNQPAQVNIAVESDGATYLFEYDCPDASGADGLGYLSTKRIDSISLNTNAQSYRITRIDLVSKPSILQGTPTISPAPSVSPAPTISPFPTISPAPSLSPIMSAELSESPSAEPSVFNNQTRKPTVPPTVRPSRRPVNVGMNGNNGQNMGMMGMMGQMVNGGGGGMKNAGGGGAMGNMMGMMGRGIEGGEEGGAGAGMMKQGGGMMGVGGVEVASSDIFGGMETKDGGERRDAVKDGKKKDKR